MSGPSRAGRGQVALSLLLAALGSACSDDGAGGAATPSVTELAGLPPMTNGPSSGGGGAFGTIPEPAVGGAASVDGGGAVGVGPSDAQGSAGVSGASAGGASSVPSPNAGGAANSAGAAGTGTAGMGTAGTGTVGTGGAPDGAAGQPNADTNLPSGVISRFPAGGVNGVCVDVPLRLTFSAPVSLGNSGLIRVFATNQPNAEVSAVDLGAGSYSETIAGRLLNLVRPVFPEGNGVVVYLPLGALSPNTNYFVTIDDGVFLDANGSSIAAIDDATTWTFTTGPAVTVSANMTVDREGGGDTCRVQSAIEAIPEGSTTPITLDISSGTYHEIVYIDAKDNLTLRGENRDTTVITYPNNNELNAGVASRGMAYGVALTNLTIESLTFFNTTPQDGSQAEALRIDGDQVILRDSNFLSLQDTVLLDGSVYVVDSYIEGNVDFIWGSGIAYLERTRVHTAGRSGVTVQARNGAGAFGYVFVDSILTADAGITGHALARIDVTAFPDSQVAFINCQMGPHISPAGWTVTPAGAATPSLRFWEFQSTDLNGAPLDTSGRVAGSRQISAAEAAGLRDRAAVLGGWNPVP